MHCDRRTFIELAGAGTLAGSRDFVVGPVSRTPDTANVAAWRQEFPVLARRVNGLPLAYLDSAATTQRPRAVIDAISRFYEGDNANPGATLHSLARLADGHYGLARATAARFLNAAAPSRSDLHERHHGGNQPRGVHLGGSEHPGRRRDRADRG